MCIVCIYTHATIANFSRTLFARSRLSCTGTNAVNASIAFDQSHGSRGVAIRNPRFFIASSIAKEPNQHYKAYHTYIHTHTHHFFHPFFSLRLSFIHQIGKHFSVDFSLFSIFRLSPPSPLFRFPLSLPSFVHTRFLGRIFGNWSISAYNFIDMRKAVSACEKPFVW